MPKDKKMWDNILTVIMSLLCLLWIYPIVLILLNSLKMEGTFTTSTVFKLPTAETFAGLSNYIYGVTKMGFLSSLGYSLVITVSSVALILLCCSMTGWYLTRVNNTFWMMGTKKGTDPKGATPPFGTIPHILPMILGGNLTATRTHCSDGPT